MIDNFQIIENSILDFSNTEDFYFVQLIQRKNKEGNTKTRVVKTFNIKSLDSYHELKDDIIKLCNFYNARAYIHPNLRNYKQLCLYAIAEFSNCLLTQSYNGKKVWDSVCGKYRDNSYPALWVVDLDSKVGSDLFSVVQHINKVRGKDAHKIKAIIPTQNGYHLITTGFDVNEFKKHCPVSVDIHKNNPTILYIP